MPRDYYKTKANNTRRQLREAANRHASSIATFLGAGRANNGAAVTAAASAPGENTDAAEADAAEDNNDHAGSSVAGDASEENVDEPVSVEDADINITVSLVPIICNCKSSSLFMM